jgi:hypothetical protein
MRCRPGAYVRRGLCLYRVDRCTPSQIVLEDAYTLKKKATTISDVRENYLLVASS